MKKTAEQFVKKLLAVLILLNFAQLSLFASINGDDSKKVTKTLPLSYFSRTTAAGSSTAKVTGTDKVTSVTFYNPYESKNGTYSAGTFKGTVDGQSASFYCIDLAHPLATYSTSQPHTYTDYGSTPTAITYILNNYYPYKSFPYTNSLSTEAKEAAAVQLAIWYYADNLDLSTVTDATIKARALAIKADADANASSYVALETLLIIPSNQSIPTGTAGKFTISTFDATGAALSGVTVNLTASTGTLSSSSAVTGSSGTTSELTLTQGSSTTSTIKATAAVTIPQGTKYVHTVSADSYQKLVLATPAGLTREVSASVTWYTPATCDLEGYTTYTQGGWGGSSNSVPGKIRDLYFSTVFPSGLTIGSTYTITLSSATAVMDFLPQSGTAAALTQNYTNPTSSISVLAGQIAALALNVAFDKAGKIGTNTTDLGDLYILSGTFAGKSVSEFLAIANKALGGETTSYSITDINETATAINENFDNGTTDNSYLTCQSLLKSSLGDKVWLDADKDGIQDSGEAGISGVTVNLYDCSGNLISTTTTDSNGNYLFSNLSAGSYMVQFVRPTNYYFTTKDVNSNGNDGTDSDADLTTGKTDCITLSAGVNDLTWDAGMYKSCKNTLGNFVWHDADVDGIQDADEKGIAGVIVELLQDTTVIATATTDTDGKYEFSNVTDGTYGVRIASSNYASGGALYSTSQLKWYATTKNAGDDTADSDAGKSEIAYVTLNCADNLTIDFGFYKTSVGITKYSDNTSYNSGDTIKYTFVVENTGDIALASGVDVYDAMLNTSGDNLIKHIDLVSPGKSVTFSMNYVAKTSDCGTLKNTVTAVGHPADGSAYVTDASSWTVDVNCDYHSDLKIEKSVDNTTPKNNDIITYTIKVTNIGPDQAKGAEVTDLLPSGLVYQSYTASQGSYDNSTGIWTIGELASGSYVTLTISVKVNVSGINTSAYSLGVAADYGLFVIQDLTQPSSDTEGKVAVGRDAVLGSYSIADKLSSNSGDVLVVGRNLTYTSGAVYNGNVVYGYSTNLPIDAVSITGGTLRKDTPIDFDAAAAYLESLSTQLGAYTVNGTTTSQWGGITLTGVDPYLNVFKVSGTDLSSANNVEISVPNGSVVLVNISGTNVKWSGGLTVSGTSITNVLYNFYEATELNIQGIDIRGSILAPFAALTYPSGVVNGQVIVKSMTGSGQFNNSIFSGNLPYERKVTNVAIISGCTTKDTVTTNNTSSALITVTNLTTSSTTGSSSSTTTTTTWSSVSSFTNGEIIYSMIYDASGNMYAGTMGGKIYKSTNNGTSWTLINSGMSASYIWSLNVSSGTLYAATNNGVFKYSGSSWSSAGLTGKDVHALAYSNGVFYAGTWGYGVFSSSDNGSTWTELNTGIESYLTIQSLTISSDGTVFVGTVGYGVLKLTGNSWTKVTSGYDVVWAMASAGTYVYAGTYGNGLLKSSDNGATWTKVTSLDIVYVYSLTADSDGKVYASSYTNGIMVSSDNGSTWSSIGMSGYGVSTVVTGSSSLYAGTKDGVIYKSATSGSSITSTEETSEVPTTYQLAQNYPNPFNPTTTIQFAVPQASRVMIRVYNSIGQEVAVLADQEFSAGTHKVTFNANGLASGMYIYQMLGKNLNITKKMMLLK